MFPGSAPGQRAGVFILALVRPAAVSHDGTDLQDGHDKRHYDVVPTSARKTLSHRSLRLLNAQLPCSVSYPVAVCRGLVTLGSCSHSSPGQLS